MSDRRMIETRVCIGDVLGPYDCELDPSNRWNGLLNPYFNLDTVSQLAARTIEMADEDGYDRTDTIHVIDGRADSADSVHVIEGGTNSEREPRAVVVRICWRELAECAKAAVSSDRIGGEQPESIAPDGEGEPLAVVLHIRWQYVEETAADEEAADVIEPNAEGLYSIGGWEWAWQFASWRCACGSDMYWHEIECLCGLTRDGQPKTPLGIAAVKAGLTLRTLAPEATSALVDLTDLARVCAVFTGDTEIDTADDTGPFDTETLGWADRILRDALDDAAPADLEAAGWEHVPDEESARLYRITFPVPPTH
ncbi:hypothetical protein [Streptomyces milbemycinicus]|uniref:hypothetical protein n=1 Tax=Streptomyces milbemycinicus TaxID=476552 RepID=UPI001FEB1D5C|nr:hypothetical protein [Streptomyces milbemycinicus]